MAAEPWESTAREEKQQFLGPISREQGGCKQGTTYYVWCIPPSPPAIGKESHCIKGLFWHLFQNSFQHFCAYICCLVSVNPHTHIYFYTALNKQHFCRNRSISRNGIKWNKKSSQFIFSEGYYILHNAKVPKMLIFSLVGYGIW